MDQHKRPLALPDISAEFLSVAGLVPPEVQEIVLDLKGGAQEEPETEEAIEVRFASRPDERADPTWIDGRIPAGLLQYHVEVVGIGQMDRVVAAPTQLDGLSLDCLARHAFGLLHDLHGEPWPEGFPIVDERAQPEESEGIADVDRDGNSV